MARQLSEAAQAAKAIRAKLKKMGIKAQVKKSNNCVDINLVDASPDLENYVKTITDCYAYEGFCGMTDSSYARNQGFDGPQARFVFVNNKFSQEIKQEYFSILRETDVNFSDLPESLKECETHFTQGLGTIATRVHRLMYEMNDETTKAFWQARKPKVKLNTKAAAN